MLDAWCLRFLLGIPNMNPTLSLMQPLSDPNRMQTLLGENFTEIFHVFTIF